MARACYSRAKFVLLDDPLSAVDAPTAKFLVDHAIRGSLKGRTCILVSHAVGLVLPFADYVVSIKNGDVVAQGHPEDVVRDPNAEGIYGIELGFDNKDETMEHDLSLHGPLSLPDKAGTKLVDDEERATGSVRLAVYDTYFKASGGLMFVCIFFLSFVVCSTIQFGNDWWLKTWTDSTAAPVPQMYNISLPNPSMKLHHQSGDYYSEMKQSVPNLAFFQVPMASNFSDLPRLTTDIPAAQPDVLFYISIYGLFGLAVITSMNLQTLIILFGSLVASRRTHNSLLASVLGAPLRFFEVTPIGRILNRFSKDVENIDKYVFLKTHWQYRYGIHLCLCTKSHSRHYHSCDYLFCNPSLFACCGSHQYGFLCVKIVVLIYMWIAQLYLKTSRELKRLDAVSRSPIYAQFSETLA